MQYFQWDINPILLTIYGSFGLRWYSLMFLAAILGASRIVSDIMDREGKEEALKDSLLAHMVVGTIVGARLGHCVFYNPWHYFTHPWEILMTWEGGLASHGGFIGILIALLVFAKKNKETPFLWLGDVMAVATIFSGGCIRIGNFFNSEIIGKVTDVPWAVVFQRVDGLPRHPSQIYEALGFFVISSFMWVLYHKWTRRVLGQLLGVGFILGFSWRFFMEFFKENQAAFENQLALNMGQLLSLPFILIGFGLLFKLHEKK
ncbi:MAG: prolipoprotein diacylglyceryl transferase [Oligoflexales bacterium]